MKKISKALVIVDSVDCSGKTKLCNHLTEKYRFNYYHCGVQPDIKEYHENVLSLVFRDIANTNSCWVIDRMHLSEEVYGNIFRNGAAYNWKEFNKQIEDKCKELGIVYKLVVCLPPKEIVVKGHAARNADGNEMFDTVDSVYDAYSKIYEDAEVPMYKYDFTKDSDYADLDKFLENL